VDYPCRLQFPKWGSTAGFWGSNVHEKTYIPKIRQYFKFWSPYLQNMMQDFGKEAMMFPLSQI